MTDEFIYEIFANNFSINFIKYNDSFRCCTACYRVVSNILVVVNILVH